MWRLKSFLKSAASRGAILCARAAFKGHVVDEVTGYCRDCGASRSFIEDNPGACQPKMHLPLEFDQVAA